MAESHSEGIQVGQFCALRAEKCSPCNAKYQKNCDPPPTGWDQFSFIQLKRIEGAIKRQPRRFEAHHLLCIASVTEFIAKKPEINEVVMQTEWCINKRPNMYAMPLWGHTIKHYCNLEEGGIDIEQAPPPPFKDIPQHNFGHTGAGAYKSEVDADMIDLANDIEEVAAESHKAAVKELATKLQGLSRAYKTELQDRGTRPPGGTHAAWQLGTMENTSMWYLPFSMATTAATEKRTFPGGFNAWFANKIKRLVAAATQAGTA